MIHRQFNKRLKDWLRLIDEDVINCLFDEVTKMWSGVLIVLLQARNNLLRITFHEYLSSKV